MGFMDKFNEFLAAGNLVQPEDRKPMGSLGFGGPLPSDNKKVKTKKTKAPADKRMGNLERRIKQNMVKSGLLGEGTKEELKKDAYNQKLSELTAAIDKEPTTEPMTREAKLNGNYYTQGSTGVDGFSKYTPVNYLAGGEQVPATDRSPIYTNIGRSSLADELKSRDQNFVSSANKTRFVGGEPIPKEKLKQLENIGLIRKPRPQPALPAAPEGPVRMYNGDGTGGRLDSAIEMTPGIHHVGAPSTGGFYDSLGRFSNALREHKENRSDSRYNREQNRLEADTQADIDYKNEQTKYYGALKKSIIDNRNSRTEGNDIKNQYLPETLQAALGLTRSKAGKLDAETAVIPSNAQVNQLLKLAQSHNQEAQAVLSRVRADLLPAESAAKVLQYQATANLKNQQADVVKPLADSQIGLRTSQSNLNNNKASVVQPLAESKIGLNASQAGANVSKANLFDSKGRLNDAQAREIPYNAASQRILDAAKAGNLQALAMLTAIKTKGWPEKQKAEVEKLVQEARALGINNQMFSNILTD